MLEKMSKEVHELWMLWAGKILEEEPGLSEERKARWKSCMCSYEELDEDMKELDRVIARKFIAILESDPTRGANKFW